MTDMDQYNPDTKQEQTLKNLADSLLSAWGFSPSHNNMENDLQRFLLSNKSQAEVNALQIILQKYIPQYSEYFNKLILLK
jgi:hypothetical protein